MRSSSVISGISFRILRVDDMGHPHAEDSEVDLAFSRGGEKPILLSFIGLRMDEVCLMPQSKQIEF